MRQDKSKQIQQAKNPNYQRIPVNDADSTLNGNNATPLKSLSKAARPRRRRQADYAQQILNDPLILHI